ncbi:DUF6678 family protein [Pseudomonas sp. NPDC089918]|uniref:DUF6678 family protein n=1 Tax=Pseudomonas sp. NPDC089918 TaxID=3390654 RepID=UPI003D055E05
MHQLLELEEISKAKIRDLLTAGIILPVMNNTKWAELIRAMHNAPDMKPEFRLHSTLAPSDYCTGWDRDWHYHIHPVAASREVPDAKAQSAFGPLQWHLATQSAVT